jgi:hypothetical protein
LKQKSGLDTSHSYLPITLSTLGSIFKANVLIWGGGHMLQDESSSLDVPYHLINVFFAQVYVQNEKNCNSRNNIS